MTNRKWASMLARRCALATVRLFFWVRITVGVLGAIGGVLALPLFFVQVGLTWNHGHGVTAGTLFSPGAEHGKYYLTAAGHHTLVSARVYWTVWTVEAAMFFSGGLMVLMFAIEGMVWLVGRESYVWGHRRSSDPDEEGTKFNDNG